MAPVLLHCVYNAVGIGKGAYCKTTSAPKVYYNHGNCTDISVAITLLNLFSSTFMIIIKPGLFVTIDIKGYPITSVIKIVKLPYLVFQLLSVRFAHILKIIHIHFFENSRPVPHICQIKSTHTLGV